MLMKTMGKEEAEWWVQLVLSGSYESYSPNDFIDDILIELGYMVKGEGDRKQYLRDFAGGWGHEIGGIRKIVNMIENVSSFSQG